MAQAAVNTYESLLRVKREEILKKSRGREDIYIVQSNEQIETIQLAGEREFAIRILEHDAKILVQIGDALRRIDDGEFGVCLECEDPISPKRLAAVPWAKYCLHCQERHDALEAADAALSRVAA